MEGETFVEVVVGPCHIFVDCEESEGEATKSRHVFVVTLDMPVTNQWPRHERGRSAVATAVSPGWFGRERWVVPV